MSHVIGVVILRAFFFTQGAAFIINALAAHGIVETISRALLAIRMASATNSLSSQWLQGSLFERTLPYLVKAIRAALVLHQTAFL